MPAYEQKNPERVAAGLKAAINNPNVSEEAREHAADRLDSMGASEEVNTSTRSTGTTNASGQETNRVLGGYKATLRNDHTSEEAKQHAREVLDASGYSVERGEDVSEDEHETRVLAGYKAALHNPRVSEEAKQHAKEYLGERGAL
ncbi:Conidiation protein 6-domain-containing protein [Amylocystis lapponica]|nr:Conidiation protein 6-domain-containing protein [Amylocystis lapponica]